MAALPEYLPLKPVTVVNEFEDQATAMDRAAAHMGVYRLDSGEPTFDSETVERLIDPDIVQTRYRRRRAAEHLTHFGLVHIAQNRDNYTVLPLDTALTFFTLEANEGPWLRIRTQRATAAGEPARLDTEVYDATLRQPLEHRWNRISTADDSGEMIQPTQALYAPLRTMLLATRALQIAATERMVRLSARSQSDTVPATEEIRLDDIL